jgi:short subunit dehydrogenase-like uncharacterized protein
VTDEPDTTPTPRGRIVVFGATGYTGRLVTAELVARGVRPVIAGRHPYALGQLAEEHADLEVSVADVADPRSVRDLVGPGDVLVTTVGPFTVRGQPALDAAIDTGAHYVDSTGEAGFIRHVFADEGPRAERRGTALLTAFGYDFVPGHVAAALAVQAAGPDVDELQVVYGGLGHGISSGTRTTARIIATEATHRLERGRLVERPVGRDVTRVQIHGSGHDLVLAGGTEPLIAPRTWPGVGAVSVWLDLGPVAWLAKAASYTLPVVMAVPGMRDRVRQPAFRTGTGPSPADRARSVSIVTAIARDAAGRELARGRVVGPNPYDLTANTLAAGAIELADRGAPQAGALGPLDLFPGLGVHEVAARLGLDPG